MEGVLSMIPNRELKLNELSKVTSSASEIDAVINELKGLEASATQINYIADEERAVPDGFDISLLPYFRVWKKKGTRLFETNVKAKKVFEDIFADKIVYVDIATGNDTTGTGTISNPYKTLYKGLRAYTVDKLTVYVKGGIYDGADGWNHKDGINSKALNVIGYGGRVVSSNPSISTTNGAWREDRPLYVEGIDFVGTTSGANGFKFIDVASFAIASFKQCSFHGISSNGLQIVRNGLYILEECYSYGNYLDGFNYHSTDAVKNQLVVEINCVSKDDGVLTGANNGSTMHDKGRIIRINGSYTGGQNRTIQDVNDCQSWMLGTYVANTRDPNANITIGNSVTATDNSKMWLDSVTTAGAANIAATIADGTVSELYVYDFEKGDCLEGDITSEYDYKTGQ